MGLHHNVLEMFKAKGIQWKPGVDPEAAINFIKGQLFNKDGSPNRLPPDLLLQKAFVQPGSATSGLAQYDLEQGARLLYPLTTIFRNMIPRVTGGTGIQANWRSITAINPTNLNIGLSEGHRGGAMSQTVVDKMASFKTSGMDNYVTEQAYLAAVTFEDLYALSATETLQGTMEAEEHLDIGANSSILLGTTPTPTQGTVVSTGGGLSNATYSVICVALTYLGMVNSTPPTAQNTSTAAGGAIALPYTRANMDGSTDLINGFSGAQSAAASIALSGGGTAQILNVAVTAVRGAFGYAWFVQSGGTGSEKLAMITGYPTASIGFLNGTGQLASVTPVTDVSTNALNYDGLLTQIVASGSGAYVKDLGGAPLTAGASGSGSIAEFDALIADRIANYRLVPTDIFMAPTDQQALGKLILTGNTNLAPFFMGASSGSGLAAAVQARVYNNPVGFSTPQLEIHAHPFIPAGTIIFYTRSNPYPLSNVPALLRKLCRRDYWQVDWPVVTLQRTLGVYFDAVLQMYFPPAFGVITGVKS